MTDTDVVVVGAGVVGLAVARRFARSGRETLIIEREGSIGSGVSSRNSEVIHAGLYYPTGSLKARLCVAGRRMLYAYAESHGVDVRRYGKLVVATCEEELPQLAAISRQAVINGVEALTQLDAGDVKRAEPEVRAVAALHSATTGVIDAHGYMLALEGDFRDGGGQIAFAAPFRGSEPLADGTHRIRVGGAEPMTLTTQTLVIAASLDAPNLAGMVEGLNEAHVPPAYYAKGHYFSLMGRAPFKQLIYPVPVPGGLGTHVTLDLAGRAKFGPDIAWIDQPDYSFDESRAGSFYEAIRRYWPGLPDGALAPDYTGIRPKIVGPDEPAADFVIQGPETHGVAGLVNLFGIESPGLTASLAIAEAVFEAV